ncbi:MAG: allophanate hydrolase subunit 1 [Deltaproteobacteria bacterium]|nr:allophanate hydrolase subunit 1 [Deltaproteobacteria bacterium]
MFYPQPRFLVAGDRYISIEIANAMNIQTSCLSVAMERAIKNAGVGEIIETIITYRAVMIYFDNLRIDLDKMIEKLRKIVQVLPEVDEIPSRLIELPCRYGGKWGPDLAFVAEVNNLKSEEEAAEWHYFAPHWVGIVGFTPGHPFLMSLNPPNKILNAPKYKIPRTYTPVGTLGHGGNITSMYTVPSPGGYQKIGLCPVPIYDPYQRLEEFSESPILLRVGDRIKFCPINDDELDNLRQAVFDGLYSYKIEEGVFSLKEYLATVKA